MAKLYGEIAAKALLTLDKSFARANGQPLDASEVYYSLAEAKAYAATTQAYIGQKIVVIENNIVTHYSVEDAAGNLKELGAKPIGDEKSIEVSSGVIAIHDFGKAFYKYVPEVKDEETGEVTKEASYEKVEVSESNPWKAGLEPKVVTENSQLVIGWFEPNPTTIEGVNDQVTAVQGTVADIEAALGIPSDGTTEATGLYKEIEDIKAVTDTVGEQPDTIETNLWATVESHNAAINEIASDYLKAADKEELQDAIDAIEVPVTGIVDDDKVLSLTDKLVSATISLSYDEDNKAIKLYGKNNTELGSVDATPFIKDGMLHDVDYNADSNTLTFTWNTDAGDKTDTVVLSDIIEPYTAGAGLELVGNEFKAKLADGSESFLTITADGIKLAGIANAIATAKQEAIDAAATAAAGMYATQTALGELETALDERLDVLETHDHSTYATKTEVNEYKAEVSNTYATKAALEPVAQDAANAKTAVGNLETRFDEIVAVGGEPNAINKIQVNGSELTITDKTVNIIVPTKVSHLTDDTGFDARITAAQSQADKGVNDASAAATAAASAQADVDALEKVVEGHGTTIISHTDSIADHLTRIGVLENANNAHVAEFNGLKTIVEGHTSTIATLATQSSLDVVSAKTSANESAIKTINETTIPGLNIEIGKKANATDVYTKTEIGTIAEGKTLVEMIADAKSEASYDDTAIKASIKANTDALAILNGDAGTAGSVIAIANAQAKAEVAAIVGAAPEAMDTLEEVANWIANDQTGAAAMAADIAANKTAIEAINNETTGILAVAKKYTDDSIAGLPLATGSVVGLVKVDDKTIQAAEDGTISVKAISTDLLTQGTQELILDGGKASGANIAN